MQAIHNRAESHGPIYGFPELLPEKRLRELVLFISERCWQEENFGAVMLRKILLQSDIAAFVDHGQSISGATYIKQPFGPVPAGLQEIENQMENGAEILKYKRTDQFGYAHTILLPLRRPHLSSFTGSEIDILCRAIDKFRHYTAGELSRVSHGVAWHGAEKGAQIPYEGFLLDNPEPTEDDEQWALSMVSQYGATWRVPMKVT